MTTEVTQTPASETISTQTTSTVTPATATEAPWFSALPQDLQADPNLVKYTSLEAAARGLTGAVKLIGERPENLIKVPAAGDAEATRAALHKLGLPETPETYTLKAIDGVPADTDLAKIFQSACFEAGVLPAAMQGVYEKVGGFLSQFEKAQTEATAAREEAHMAQLKQTFGGALDDTLARAEVVSEHFGLTKDLNDAGLGTHPGVITLLSKMFPSLQEDTAGSRRDSGAAVKSPQEYIAEANELQQQALKEPVRSRQIELANKAFRLRQLANAGK